MKRCSLVALALLSFSLFSTTVLAANREIKFYVSNDFRVPDGFRGADEATLKDRLATYVQYMNAILANSATNLQLTYNAASTVFVTQEVAKNPPSHGYVRRVARKPACGFSLCGLYPQEA